MYRACALLAIMAGAMCAVVGAQEFAAQEQPDIAQPQEAATNGQPEVVDTSKVQEALVLLQQALNLVKYGCKNCDGSQQPQQADQQQDAAGNVVRVKRQFDWTQCWTCGGSKIIPGTAAPIG